MKFINIKQLKSSAAGRWIEIASALAPDLSLAISKLGRHVTCPVHGGVDGFRLAKDFNHSGCAFSNKDGTFQDGFALLSWLYGWSFRKACEEVDAYLGNVNYDKTNVVKPFVVLSPVKTGDFSKVTKLWEIGKTPAQAYQLGMSSFAATKKYLESRALNIGLLADSDIRLVDNLFYGKNNSGASLTFPGFVAAVRNSVGEMQTLHRFYLTQDGKKADVEHPRKMMAIAEGKTVTGAAIRLGKPVDGILGVAEGLETALSVVAGTGMACWSCLTAHGVASFEPPVGVKTIVVFADKDVSETGARAATSLKERMSLKGIKVLKVFPKLEIEQGQKGVDWNDALVQHSPFPPLSTIKMFAAA